jgi:Protein of unknown function (DUF3072)
MTARQQWRNFPMTDKHPNDQNLSKLDPHEWKTGDEPMTAAQRSYLETLTREAGEHLDPNLELTKADAALRIEELQARTGRGNAANTREPAAPVRKPVAHAKPSVPRTPYRDRPTDDGMHGDGGADPSGVGDQSRRDAP